MKHFFIILTALLLSAASLSAQTAYAIWDSNHKTLYFDNILESDVDSYYPTGASYWEADYSGNTPPWCDTAKSTCEKVVFTERFAKYYPKTTSRWFYEFKELQDVQGINYLKTDSVTNMSMMFSYCFKLTSLDLSSFNTSKVTNMYGMFSSSKFGSLDLSSFDTSNVINMQSMFSGCELLESVNLSNFDTSKVKYMSQMFFHCSKLSTLDLSGFNTSGVVNMQAMFYNCYSLTTLNLSNFDTSKVTVMKEMFYKCIRLTTIYCNDIWTADDSENMFFGSTLLKGAVAYDETKVDVSMANPTNGYFTKYVPEAQAILCEGDSTLYFDYTMMAAPGDTYQGQTVTSVLHGDDLLNSPTEAMVAWNETVKSKVKKVVFQNSFADIRPKSTSYWFLRFTNLEKIEGMENLNTSEVTSMNNMFRSCGKLTEIDLAGFNTAQVTNMQHMFRECSSLATLDLTGFDISSLTATDNMFADCNSLTTIYCNDDWRMGKITSSYGMFIRCTSLVGAVKFDNNKVELSMANPTNGYFSAKAPSIPGDVNEDGSVDINDVVAIINVMAGNATWPNATVNGDTNVDINDVVAVINIMAGH